jgi:DNA-binding PadR family transcriptional regulator
MAHKYCSEGQIDLGETSMARALGEFEQMILLALVRFDENAYGVTIKEEIEQQTGREIFVGAVYTALSRLQKQGCVSSSVGEAAPKRGGRRKKFYALEPKGEAALNRTLDAYRDMTRGIEGRLEAIAGRRSR